MGERLGRRIIGADAVPLRRLMAPGGSIVTLDKPITHTSFDGDSFSTVGTSTEIGPATWSQDIPAGARALLLQVKARDSAAWGTGGLHVSLGPTATYYDALICGPTGGDVLAHAYGLVPCSEGSVWYQCAASGAGTLDVWLLCWGYVV